MLDRPAIFEKVYRHLLAQGQPAILPEGYCPRCVYRTSTGLKCAIGVLIDDAEFEPPLNGEPLTNPDVIEMLQRSGLDVDLSTDDLEFLIALQGAHDEGDPQEDRWLDEVGAALARIADDYHLVLPIPVTATEHQFALRRKLRLKFKMRWQSRHDRSEECFGVDLNGTCDGDEFEDIEPPLKLLNFVHE